MFFILVFARADGGAVVGCASWFGFGFGFAVAFAFAGIRDSLARFTRRPCAGRHLLFFAAAKK
ncbi:hypothetical protein, partial [Paraburkholderia caribensis]|uniref:hypothetical protein n=1 Tax=Paraburkholderia caribensis TaxID=75105 RepID=UPI0031DE42C7